MRVLFVSPTDAAGASLCYRIKREGSDLKWLVLNGARNIRSILDGLVEKVTSLKKGLKWVGKDGLIVVDDSGVGKLQDELRSEGYSVVGGCELGDRLELDRGYGQRIMEEVGMTIPFSLICARLSQAMDFLEDNEGPWVVKQNGKAHKTMNYVGKFPDNRDTISLLQNYRKNEFCKNNCINIQLQKRVYGVEIAVGRYFNGIDWVGPIDLNVEHKDLCSGDLGPKTFEMGTLMWHTDDENNRLFQSTLAKLKPYLQAIDFRGDIDINCIVNEEGAFPLEVTSRFGYPATELQMEIYRSPWSEFLKAVADGQNYDLSWRSGYGIVALLATPPFPYFRPRFTSFSPEGLSIHFKDGFTDEDLEHIHLNEVAVKENGEYYVCGNSGYILHVSGMGQSVAEARDNVYSIMQKIVLPKKFYRDDIGMTFSQENEQRLGDWGYL